MKIVLGSNLSQSFRTYFNDLAATRTDVSILDAAMDVYPSGEGHTALKDSPAGEDVTVYQTVSGDFNKSAMDLFFMVGNLKRYGAKSVTVAMPFAPYARQDKLEDGKLYSLAGEDFPRLLKAAGADKIVTTDVHSKKGEQFYINTFGANNVTFLSNTALFAADILNACNNNVASIVNGAPDGSNKPADAAQGRARTIARIVHNMDEQTNPSAKMFFIEKMHKGISTTEVVNFQGDVRGKLAAVIDDMSDSGGTIGNACEALLNQGASNTIGYLSHGLFNEAAIDKILSRQTNGKRTVGCLVVTDGIPGLEAKRDALRAKHPDIDQRFRILPCAPSFAAVLLKPAV